MRVIIITAGAVTHDGPIVGIYEIPGDRLSWKWWYGYVREMNPECHFQIESGTRD